MAACSSEAGSGGVGAPPPPFTGEQPPAGSETDTGAAGALPGQEEAPSGSTPLAGQTDGTSSETQPATTPLDGTPTEPADSTTTPQPVSAEALAPREFTCGTNPVALDTTLFSAGESDGQTSGWNHGPGIGGDYAAADYATDPATKVLEDSTCPGGPTWQSTLVKKYHDWDQQHVNGFEVRGFQVPVADVGKLVLELRFDPEFTSVPTPNEVQSHFQGFMDGQGLEWDAEQLDGGNATLLLTLEEKDDPDTSQGSYKAKFKISVAPEDFGKWLRYEVPADGLSFFYLKDWAPETLSHEEALATGTSFTKALLVAELESEGSIRAIANSSDPDLAATGWAGLNVPPLFAEHAISLRTLGLAQNSEPTPAPPTAAEVPGEGAPVVAPPATQPPATQPPATQPPATQPPATQPPPVAPPQPPPPVVQPPPVAPPPASLPRGTLGGGACSSNTGIGNGSGDKYPCVATTDGSALCFNGDQASVLTLGGAPATGVVAISNTDYGGLVCATFDDGSVQCGRNGHLDEFTLVESGALTASVSFAHSCALLDDQGQRSVTCRNGDESLQSPDADNLYCFRAGCCVTLGDGDTQCWGDKSAEPLPGPAAFIAGGDGGLCAALRDGRLMCWGSDSTGQMGGIGDQSSPTQVPMPEGADIISAAGGQWHSCWLSSAGNVLCSGTGNNSNGGGGDNDTPGFIEHEGGGRLSDIVAVTAGKEFGCAIDGAGSLYCWGSANSGNPQAKQMDLLGKSVWVPENCR